MQRLAALAFVLLAGLSVPASAATIIPHGSSSLSVQCPSTAADPCNLSEWGEDVDIESELLNPSYDFDFLEFEVLKGRGNEPQKRTDLTGDSFTAVATFAFKLFGGDTIYKVVANGTGFFTTENNKFKSFAVQWANIEDLVIQNVGVFRFKPLDAVIDPERKEAEIAMRVTYTSPAAVPLPAGAWLLISALSVLGLSSLRRRRATA